MGAKNPYPLVKVVWLDAHGSAANAAYSFEEIPHAPVEVVSYGVLLRNDDVGVSIASEICDTNTFRGYSFVPAAMLVKVEPVKPVRKTRPITKLEKLIADPEEFKP